MLVAEERSLRDYPPPRRAEAPIQLIQGWYYLVVGLWVAIGITSLQSPSHPTLGLAHMWIARAIGLVAAVVGIGLIIASRQKKAFFLTSGGPIALAVLLILLEVITMVTGLLPTTFLLETGVELGFLIWWTFALYQIIRR
jgi:hypothetical protein